MKKEFNKVLGLSGEVEATKFLKAKKYKIIETNHCNRLGELDIVAEYKNIIVFVEVKARATLAFGRPSEAVNAVKRNKLRMVANLYLLQHQMMDRQCRFDVIEIIGNEINHIENAF